MDERDEPVREPPRVERETTIITTGGGDRGGGSGAIMAILFLLVLAVIAFVLFSGVLNRGDTDLDIKVKTPDVELPKIDPPTKPSSGS
ncbi:MAG TPA: hypothetical protein VGB54_08740 [Allosphingosinicella sp.]|jgi:hypothetical protein